MYYRGVIKYQSNLDEHKPNCFVLPNNYGPKTAEAESDVKDMEEPLPFSEPYPEPEHFALEPISLPEHMVFGEPEPISTPEHIIIFAEPEPFSMPEHLILPEPEQVGEPFAHTPDSTKTDSNEEILYKSDSHLYRTRIYYNGSFIDVVECDQPPPKFSSCQKQVRRRSMS